MKKFEQVLTWSGVVALLVGYFLLTSKIMVPGIVFNIIGQVLLMWSFISSRNWAMVVAEMFFVFVSIVQLVKGV
jgi:hypothetical protein